MNMDIFDRKGKFIIFKHSTTCPISVAVKQEVDKYKGGFEVMLVDVLKEQVNSLVSLITAIKSDVNYTIFDATQKTTLDESETRLNSVIAIINV